MCQSNRYFEVTRLIAILGLVACTDATAVVPKPDVPIVKPSVEQVTVLATNPPLGATAGRSFSFDALAGAARFTDPRHTGLSYSVSLSPSGTGLTVVNGRIVGVPTSSGMVRATVRATDTTGSSAESTSPIFVFAADLTLPALPATPYAYSDNSSPLPTYFANSPTVHNADNMTPALSVTDAGAALGRVLFYDRRLSANDAVSCSSCHLQAYAFSDTARLSRGFAGNFTLRHSMPLTDVRFYRPARFFRDERAATLEDQVLQPISDAIEMGLPADYLVPKLSVAGFYRPLFQAAFGSDSITPTRVGSALSQFVRSLVSKDATFDRVNSATMSMTTQERDGETIFIGAGRCRDCHESYAFVSDAVRNNGLDASISDPGAGQGKFKAPSLRNVATRTVFMHDGRFRTLEEIVDFYDHGVQESPSLDPLMRDVSGTVRRLHLTDAQKLAVIAFMKTLTDESFLRDPRFANPFATTASSATHSALTH